MQRDRLSKRNGTNLMPGKKREREEVEPSKKPKKIKFADDTPTPVSKLVPDELDFPRGGGSAFTKDVKSHKKRKSTGDIKKKKTESVRVEHLNYKVSEQHFRKLRVLTHLGEAFG